MKQRADVKTRLTAWLLCVAMLLALSPMTAVAAEKTEEVTLNASDWEVEFQYNDGVEDKTDEGTLKSYVSMSSDNSGITMAVNTQESTVSNGGYYLYYNSKIENAKRIKITYTYSGNIYWAGLFCFDANWSYISGNNGEFSFDSTTTVNRIGFNVSSESAINGTLKVTKVEVTTEDNSGGETPPAQEYTITTKSDPDWISAFTPAGPVTISGDNQEFTVLEQHTDSNFDLKSITATMGGEDASSRVSRNGSTVTVDTTNVTSNIVLLAKYEWTDHSGDNPNPPVTGGNTITTIQPTLNGEAVEWFEPFDPTSAAVSKGPQVFTLKVDVWKNETGAAQPDSVKAVKKGTDEDVSSAISLSLDKTTGKVTLDTTGVDYDIVLSANYVWVNAPTPVDPNTNTIKSVFIGGGERQDYENKEAMDPYKADYEPGDKPEFKVATTLWGGFPLDKITASLTADGTDITNKLTIEDGESGFKKVTIDTTGLSGSIELLATYSSSWSSGGGGGGGGGSLPTITQNPNGGKGTNTSVVAAGTLVSAVRAETKGGVLTMEVTPETVKELIAQVKDNPSNTDLITIQPKFHTSGSASALVIQSADLDTLSNKTTAGLKSEGPVADITISHETVEQLAKRGNEVSINARRESQNTYSVSISSGGQKLNDLPMYVDIHTTCGFYTQAYLVKDSGETELIRWAIADQSGRTMRVFLPGAATVKFETNPPVNFMDMPQDSWGTGPVAFVASRGIFSGYDDGYFHPNTPMNRAMLVQILYGFEGKPDSGTAQFGDVKPTDWYAQAVGWAAEKGITKGCGNGQFGVSSIVSRQDAICFIYRWMGSPKANEGVLEQYSDAGSISPYARQAIAWALENDILTGDTASTISPTAQVTRYQAAKLITDLVQSQTAWNGSGKEG